MLLTGCTGWLGQSIVPYFAERYECDVLSRKFSTETNLRGDARTIELPHEYDYIIHGALDGAQNIVNQAGDAKMLFLSSGAVYNRQTPYADAKRRDEEILKDRAVIARLFCFMGPNMPEHYAAGEFLACACGGQPLTVRDPFVVRSYMHVDDLPPILESVLLKEKVGMSGDIGSGKPVTMLELATHIAQLSDSLVTVLPGKSRDSYVPHWLPKWRWSPYVPIDGVIRRSL